MVQGRLLQYCVYVTLLVQFTLVHRSLAVILHNRPSPKMARTNYDILYVLFYLSKAEQIPVQLWTYWPSLGLLIKILHDIFFQQETLK